MRLDGAGRLHGSPLGASHEKEKALSYMQIFSCVFVGSCLASLSFRPDWPSVVALVFAFVLCGVVAALEKRGETDADGLKAQLKDLKGKVEMLMVGKGFGR